jgi:hypothetical protein
MALSAPLESEIKEELRDTIYREYGDWFPRPYCDEHKQSFLDTKLSRKDWVMESCCKTVRQYDIRTPGLFKNEFEGSGIVALNSKTYHCWNNDTSQEKYSSKGLSKSTNTLTRENFLNVLRTGKTLTGKNKGFIRVNQDTFSYSQIKSGLTYFYAKRRVCDDGVSTENIDL